MATPAKVGQLDQSAAFEKLPSILDELHEKIKKQLTVFPKDQQPFQHFASPDGSVNGSLLTFTEDLTHQLVQALWQKESGF